MGISTQRLILIVLLLERRRKQKGNADELKRLAAEVDAKSTAVADVLNAKSGKQKVSIQVPAGVKVDTWTYDGQTYAGSGEQEVELKDGKQIQIHLVEDGELCQARLMLKSL